LFGDLAGMSYGFEFHGGHLCDLQTLNFCQYGTENTSSKTEISISFMRDNWACAKSWFAGNLGILNITSGSSTYLDEGAAVVF